MTTPGRLFVCSTPIGNLGDISTRLVETLTGVDVVYAEDTRRTTNLLSHLGISTRARSLFAGNEAARTVELIADLESGLSVALVSDAGTPTISDPGAGAVRLARENGFEVTVIPGPSAVTMAVALSGFAGDRFVFEGFLPKKGAQRRARIEAAADESRPVVFFLTPHRLATDLGDLLSAIGPDRPIAIARELTKLHEEVWVGSLGEAVDHWGQRSAKGEFTVVLGPREETGVPIESAVGEAREMVTSGTSLSEAARQVSERTGISRRILYQALLDGQELS